MSMLSILAILVVVATGYGIYKSYNVNIVLLVAGLALNLLAVLFGVDTILPPKSASTGFVGFDLFELLRIVSRSQIGSTGFIILVAGGFAAYMDQIGASDKLVYYCLKPLKKMAMPYVVLSIVFILAHFLGLVITSAAGLAMLLVVSVYPILLGLGVSGTSAAAVIASALIFSYAPSSAIAVLAAKTAGIDPMEYLLSYQVLACLPAALLVMVIHGVLQKFYDRREPKVADATQADVSKAKKTRDVDAIPGYYALFPLVPLVLLFVFNKLVYKTIVLDVATAMFIGWVFALLIDWVTRRNTDLVFKDATAMLKGMGNMLTNVVGLIFVAALFAQGLQNAGVVDMMINAAKGAGLGLGGTGLVMSAVIGLITFLTGSGVASFTSLVPLAPTIAQSFNSSPVELTMMMQIASECLRPISPVAGVVIIVAGFAGVSPLKVVKRTLIPCLVGYVVATGITFMMM